VLSHAHGNLTVCGGAALSSHQRDSWASGPRSTLRDSWRGHPAPANTAPKGTRSNLQNSSARFHCALVRPWSWN